MKRRLSLAEFVMVKVMAEGEACGSSVGGSWSTAMAIVPPCFGAAVATADAALAVVAAGVAPGVAPAVAPVPPELALVAVVAVDAELALVVVVSGSPLELFDVHAARSVTPLKPMTRNASRRCSRCRMNRCMTVPSGSRGRVI
jgi:hypothetical protein